MELPVGFCGIIKLTTQIIHRNLKHFVCIAFILALPYSFLLALTTLVQWPSSSSSAHALAHTISLLYRACHGEIPPPPDMSTQLPPPHYPLLIAISLFSFFSHLVTLPLLTFSVCRAVLNKSLACKSSLLAVPRSALNLILTGLCIFVMFLGVWVGMWIPMVIVVAGSWAIGNIDSTVVMVILGVVMVVMVILGVVIVGVMLYLGIAWSLAYTVAILEEKRGWEAMKRSMYLVDGSKWVVFHLVVVFGVCIMFLPISATDEASAVWRWSCAVLSLGLQVVIGLLNMACMVVLYLSCKSRFKEPLDNLIALSAQFGPPETSAKYMDLESAPGLDKSLLSNP